jgi:hypothetical protein
MLEGVEYTGITEGKYEVKTGEDDLNKGYGVWSSMADILSAYILENTFYQWRSEFIYFERSERVKEMFSLAADIAKSPKVSTTSIGNEVPDEFAINIACCIVGIAPHEYKWSPCYWDRIHRDPKARMKPAELFAKYYILSTGGNSFSPFTKMTYNSVAKAAHNKLGLQFLFELQPKRSAITERKTL